jgi:heme/copper-type cytochrome/quinol oxidase subunit 1
MSKSYNATTSGDGRFRFPWRIMFTFPFVETFATQKVTVTVCEICANSRFGRIYHDSYFVIGDPNLVETRLNFISRDSSFYLAPLVQSNDCGRISDEVLAQECTRLNS